MYLWDFAICSYDTDRAQAPDQRHGRWPSFFDPHFLLLVTYLFSSAPLPGGAKDSDRQLG